MSEEKKVRNPGKTKRDRENGVKQANQANKDARALWSKGVTKAFPFDTCNGKKSQALRKKKGKK